MKLVYEETNLEKSNPIRTNTLDMTFEHKCDDNVQHKLSIVFIVQANQAVSRDMKSDLLKFQLAIFHTNKNQQGWMVRLYIKCNCNLTCGFLCLSFNLLWFAVAMFILVQLMSIRLQPIAHHLFLFVLRSIEYRSLHFRFDCVAPSHHVRFQLDRFRYFAN